MIKLNPNPTFKAPVRLTVPGDPDPAEISMTFRHKTPGEVVKWFKTNEQTKSAEALDQIITDWEGVTGDDGQPVAYSKEALATLLKNYPPATGEIIRAWRAEMQESRIKN